MMVQRAETMPRKGSIVLIYLGKVFLAFSFFIFNAAPIHADISNESFVALAPDKELCEGSEGRFLPLPNIGNTTASSNFVLSLIDDEFGAQCKLNGLLIKGEITENTLPQLKLGMRVLEERRNNERIIGANSLWLHSPGGLLLEAIKIGDFIAEKEMEAVVALNGHCYSSCVFIYAAARLRAGYGDIGIHRPFASEVSTDNLNYAEYLEKYDALTPLLKQFFSKYGVSPSLVDSMNIIPSDEVKILSYEELESYGLGFSNVAAKEYEKAKTIQLCGKDYYDTHLLFHSLIRSCEKRLNIGVLDFDDQGVCWDLAHQAYPDYSRKFDECKAKKDEK